jgi:signal transduction histidine kinase
MNLLDRLAVRTPAVVNAGLVMVLAAVAAREDYDIAVYHRHWVMDGVVALAIGAAALLRGRGLPRAMAAALAVAAAADLAAWAGHLPGQPGGAASLALLVLTAAVVRRLPPRPAVALAVAALAIGISSALRPGGAGSFELATVLLAQGWAVAVAAGLGLRLLDSRHRAAIESARWDERRELARELHDAAAHHITGIVIQAQAARIAARQGPGPLDDALAGIESASTDALTSMRQVVGLLRETDDSPGRNPGPGQLSELVERFARRGPAVQLQLPPESALRAWPAAASTTVYRIVQESLTNVARHAPGAEEVSVAVTQDAQAISVEVTNNGPAASPHWAIGGYGLAGMRERVAALGGTLQAGPGPDTGWAVLATWPCPAPASPAPSSPAPSSPAPSSPVPARPAEARPAELSPADARLAGPSPAEPSLAQGSPAWAAPVRA